MLEELGSRADVSDEKSRDIRRSAIKAIVFMSLQEVSWLGELGQTDLEFKGYLYYAAQEVCLLPNIRNQSQQVKSLASWLEFQIPNCSPHMINDLF